MSKRNLVFILFTALWLSTALCYAQEGPNVPLKERHSQVMINDLDLDNMDVRSAMAALASQSGVNITVDDDVKGRVKVYLFKMPFMDALRVVVDLTGAAYDQGENGIRVMTMDTFEAQKGRSFADGTGTKVIALKHIRAEEFERTMNQMKSSTGKVIVNQRDNAFILMDKLETLATMTTFVQSIDVPVITQTFHLRYAMPHDVLPHIEPILTSGTGKVDIDDKNSNLIITDRASRMEDIGLMIKRYDLQNKVITLDVKVIQILLNDEHQMGVDWEAIVSDYQSLKFNGFDADHEFDRAARLSFGTISNEDFTILLDALDTVGIVNDVSDIKLTTSDTEESELIVNSIDTLHSPNTAQSFEQEEEVRLFIASQAIDDKTLNLNVRPVRAGQAAANSEEGRKNKAAVKLDDGELIVIGSLFKDVTVESLRKIPLLGDLPLLGFAFRKEGQTSQRTEIIIFLTPKPIR